MRIATLSLWTVAAVATLLAVACDGPMMEPRDAPKLDIPSIAILDPIRISTVASDAAITSRVKTAVFAEPAMKSLDVLIDTKDATVTLSGSVDSEALSERAIQIAAATPGVRGVVDKLVLKTTS